MSFTRNRNFANAFRKVTYFANRGWETTALENAMFSLNCSEVSTSRDFVCKYEYVIVVSL